MQKPNSSLILLLLMSALVAVNVLLIALKPWQREGDQIEDDQSNKEKEKKKDDDSSLLLEKNEIRVRIKDPGSSTGIANEMKVLSYDGSGTERTAEIKGDAYSIKLSNPTRVGLSIKRHNKPDYLVPMLESEDKGREISIEMDPGITVKGKIQFKDSGDAPPKKFRIHLIRNHGGYGRHALSPDLDSFDMALFIEKFGHVLSLEFSGTDGAFIIEGVQPGFYHMLVTAPGYPLQQVERGPDNLPIYFVHGVPLDKDIEDYQISVSPGKEYKGRVLRSDGSPLKDVSVYVGVPWTGVNGRTLQTYEKEIITGGNGEYRIRLKDSHAYHPFMAGYYHENYANQILHQKDLVNGAPDGELADVKMPIGGSLILKVTDLNNRPQGDHRYEMQFAPGYRYYRLVTDETGRVEVNNLCPGAYTISHYGEPYIPSLGSNPSRVGKNEINITDEAITEVEWTVRSGITIVCQIPRFLDFDGTDWKILLKSEDGRTEYPPIKAPEDSPFICFGGLEPGAYKLELNVDWEQGGFRMERKVKLFGGRREVIADFKYPLNFLSGSLFGGEEKDRVFIKPVGELKLPFEVGPLGGILYRVSAGKSFLAWGLPAGTYKVGYYPLDKLADPEYLKSWENSAHVMEVTIPCKLALQLNKPKEK